MAINDYLFAWGQKGIHQAILNGFALDKRKTRG